MPPDRLADRHAAIPMLFISLIESVIGHILRAGIRPPEGLHRLVLFFTTSSATCVPLHRSMHSIHSTHRRLP